MTHRADEINAFMLSTFEEEGIEDLPENRIAFLKGLQAAWEEPDPEDDTLTTEQAVEKSLYKLALWGELLVLKLRLKFQ